MPVPDLSPRASAAALLAVLLALGLWPYHEILGWLPWGADATKWIARGSLDDPGWWRWAVESKHFVGYRPVTALSYTLNHALTGYAAWGYRGTDLALHLASGALLFALYRGLTGDRSALGLVPVVLLLLHPATQEVVPHAARRSYLLATAFGLGALLAWVHALRGPRPRPLWVVLAAELLALAVLSNELAYVFAPLLVLLALDRALFGSALGAGAPEARPRPRDLLAALALPAAVTALAVARRYAVLGTFGGYAKRFFAFVHNDTPMWRELTSWQPDRIAGAAWLYTLDPTSVMGSRALFSGAAAPIAAGALTVWLLWAGLIEPCRRWREPGVRVRLVLVAWLLGAGAIVVLSQTWFWRQAYGLLPPLGMLGAAALRDAIVGFGVGFGARRRVHALGLAAGAAWLGAALYRAPLPVLYRGAHNTAIAGTPVVGTLERMIAEIDGPALVYLVLPVRSNTAHIARIWASRYGAREKIEPRLLGHLRPSGDPKAASLELDRDGERPKLVLGRGMRFAEGMARSGYPPSGPQALPLDRLWKPSVPVWLIAVDADEAWAVRVGRPPAGAGAPIEVPDEVPDEGVPDEGVPDEGLPDEVGPGDG